MECKCLVLASSKGGAGKSTICMVVAGRLAKQGVRVAVLDADPNGTISSWHRDYAAEYPMTVVHEVEETEIVPRAEELMEGHDLVIIDTAGFGNRSTVYALAVADHVLIPSQPSGSDLREAAKTIKMVQAAEKMTKRTIPARVVLTRFNDRTKVAAHVLEQLAGIGVERLQTTVAHRTVYFEMTFSGQVPVGDAAGQEIDRLVAELAELGAVPSAKAAAVA
ncbi:MAG: ParA family protein [Alphaproteobacteria bacterium]|nr:ParA family protein [Alphaproteobacteria bacterium]